MAINDSVVPDASRLFEPIVDTYGSRLALVFGNENDEEGKEGMCPFVDKCGRTYCDIGSGEGAQFTSEMNRQRLGFFKEQYNSVLEGVEHLIIYNSGSVLNRNEMSQETLSEILGYASTLQDCKVVSLDSREMYVTEKSLDYVVEKLREYQQARVIIGVETQDDDIRIGKLDKPMTKRGIERAFEVVGRYKGKMGIDVNIVFQLPGVLQEDAIAEAVKTAEFSLNLARKYGVPVDFNFHAYYPSATGRELFPDHPRSVISDELEAIRRIQQFVEGDNSQLFLGWQDEGHDQEQPIRKIEEIRFRRMFDQFNRTQDIKVLNK